ncbi:MAG: hypothetical protein K2X81_05520 [Candidatus Obscuribacterales bacterium]|nr:hypothetical protein [Candidatus Obscuribacterales bacterium]
MKNLLKSFLILLSITSIGFATEAAQASSSKKESNKATAKTPKDIASVSDLSDWMANYYMHPQPELLVPALLLADKQGLFQGDSAPPLQAFAGRVMAQNPDQIKQWFTDLSGMSDNGKSLVLTSVWWANCPQGKELLDIVSLQLSEKSKAEFRKQIDKAPVEIDKMDIDSPDILDMLWACFCATGDEKYVKRVMSTLSWSKQDHKDLNKMIIASAARWSLLSNIEQHKKVKEICETVEKQDAELKPYLEKVLAEAAGAGKAEKGDKKDKQTANAKEARAEKRDGSEKANRAAKASDKHEADDKDKSSKLESNDKADSSADIVNSDKKGEAAEEDKMNTESAAKSDSQSSPK